MEFPVGAGEITIIGTGGVNFEDKRDVIVYDNRHVILVQTSASTYRPQDVMEVRVVVTNEELIPIETGEVLLEIYVCCIPNYQVTQSKTIIILGRRSQTCWSFSKCSNPLW